MWTEQIYELRGRSKYLSGERNSSRVDFDGADPWDFFPEPQYELSYNCNLGIWRIVYNSSLSTLLHYDNIRFGMQQSINSVFGNVTTNKMADWGLSEMADWGISFCSRYRQKIFISIKRPDRPKRPVQTPIQWLPAALFPWIMLSIREADHSTPFGAKFKNARSYTSNPTFAFIACTVTTFNFLVLV